MSNCYDPEFIIEGLADVSPMLLGIQANAGVFITYLSLMSSQISIIHFAISNDLMNSGGHVIFRYGNEHICHKKYEMYCH